MPLTLNEVQVRSRQWAVAVASDGDVLVVNGKCRLFHISVSGGVNAGGQTIGNVYDAVSVTGTPLVVGTPQNWENSMAIPEEGIQFDTGLVINVSSGNGQLVVAYLPES